MSERVPVAPFGGLPRDHPGARAPRYSVLPVPFDLTVSYVSGTRLGPEAILEASAHMELYDEELGCEPSDAGIETLPPPPPAGSPEEMIDRVASAVDGIAGQGRVPVTLGGEHSITLGAVRALVERYPGLSVLQLDAHADMRDSYMDSPFNHACVARRVSELCPVVQLGVRSLSTEEAEYLDSIAAAGAGGGGGAGLPRVVTRYAPEVLRSLSGGGGGTGGGAEGLLSGLAGDVYVTIDIDVLDPSIMPSTGTPEPGGLGWYDVLAVLSAVARAARVVGFDIVELCPQPGNVAPDFLCAKLAYKMMGYINRA
ncbi:MAG: agmatinase family protein [Thermodesulfobacteriota bacterium]